jgi:poly(hydroxyalkanoate) granule-associated protein
MAVRRKKTSAASPIGKARARAAKAHSMIRDAFESAQDTMQERVDSAREQAQETWDNLESLFQSRVHKALQQIGVPTAEEIRLLTQRVADLSAAVRAMERRQPRQTKAGKRAGAKRRARA